MSLTFGKFLRFILLSESNVAANIGKEAFFEPDISIVPLSLFAPKTSSFCIIILLAKLHQFGPYISHLCQHMSPQVFHFLLKK